MFNTVKRPQIQIIKKMKSQLDRSPCVAAESLLILYPLINVKKKKNPWYSCSDVCEMKPSMEREENLNESYCQIKENTHAVLTHTEKKFMKKLLLT